jgi:hypothetical protein
LDNYLLNPGEVDSFHTAIRIRFRFCPTLRCSEGAYGG